MYIGKKMSANAVAAYERGLKPFSKWTKADILKGIKEVVQFEEEEIKKLKTYNLATLRELLTVREWHHTGKCYNKTDFYDIQNFSSSQEVFEFLEDHKHELKRKLPAPPVFGFGKWEYWERVVINHFGKKAYRLYTEDSFGELRGNWFYYEEGKKNYNSEHFLAFYEVPLLNVKKNDEGNVVEFEVYNPDEGYMRYFISDNVWKNNNVSTLEEYRYRDYTLQVLKDEKWIDILE